MKKRIAITGLGILTPNGIGKKPFWKSLWEGTSGVKPVTLFSVEGLRTKLAGEIQDFDPKAILGPKGLRNLDRTTLLVMCASKMALLDANLATPVSEDDTDSYGVSIGSTMGSVWSISEFDKGSLRDGPRSVNPAHFANTVINSPASHISIKFNIQGFNATVATGFCSSLDAIYYALNMMNLYDYKVVLSGGVEELCEQTYKGFHKIGHLAGSRPGKEEIVCPFDRRRNGIMAGEGACIAILEEYEHAKARNAKIYAEILGFGTAFDPQSKNIHSPKAVGARDAIKNCLDDSRLNKEDVDYISACANSTLDCDVMETRAIKGAFKGNAKDIPVSSIKSMIGDSFSASGAINLGGALGVLENNIIPPTINYEKPDKRCDLDYVPNKAREKKISKIIINSFSPTGNNSSLSVGRV